MVDSERSLVPAEMPHVAQVATLARLEQILTRVSTEDLAGGLEEDPGIRNEPRDGNAGVVDAVFTADEVLDDERPIGPWQHVIVQPVDLAERRAHLAHLRQEPTREFRKRQESLLDIDALLAKRNKEVGARVGVDDGLERRLGFVHLEGRIGIDSVPACGAEEVADDRHVGIEHLGAAHGRTCRPVDGQRAARTAGSCRAGWHLRLRRGRRHGRGSLAALDGSESRFKGSQTVAVLLLQGVEIFPKLINLIPPPEPPRFGPMPQTLLPEMQQRSCTRDERLAYVLRTKPGPGTATTVQSEHAIKARMRRRQEANEWSVHAGKRRIPADDWNPHFLAVSSSSRFRR